MGLNKYFSFDNVNKEELLKKLTKKLVKEKGFTDVVALHKAEGMLFKATHLEKIKLESLKNVGLRPGITFYFNSDEEIKQVAKYFNVNFSVMGVDDSSLLLKILDVFDNKIANIVGYDLDGVICETREVGEVSYRKLNGKQRKEYIANKIKHYKEARVLNVPIDKEFYIITGRTEKYGELTRAWLKRHNINPVKLFMNKVGGRAQDHIKHKIDTIKELGITKYYEDSKRVFNGLKKECPNVNIIFVKGKM